jgi:hypothetical protein
VVSQRLCKWNDLLGKGCLYLECSLVGFGVESPDHGDGDDVGYAEDVAGK